MPAYRFSWDAFDDRTISALTARLGYKPGKHEQTPRAFLAQCVKRPTAEFVAGARRELVDTWLPEYRGLDGFVERLVEAGLGPGDRPRTPEGRLDFVRATRNSPRFRKYLLEAMLRFGDQDRVGPDEGIGDFVPRIATVHPKEQPPDPRSPHAYQLAAWDRLGAHLAELETTGVFRGLLVMPTGSGKTYTAVRWLVSNVLARKGRVLWLAHRSELLNQSASEFHKLAAFAPNRDRIRVRIVSGQHCGATQIDPADDVIVASIASLARSPEVVGELLRDDDLFVVIDEAHHAPSRSYRNVIARMEGRKRFRLLGLTATPTRTRESERGPLRELFGGRVIHQVEVATLTEQGILARARPVRVQTRANVEVGRTPEDERHLQMFNDLGEEWLGRIAHIESRNAVIVDHYVANRGRYKQTLVFAINVEHAVHLTELFRQRGVNAEYVASYRPDLTDGDTREIIERFRQGAFDVLVNVQIVAEGVDVPAIGTVFMARPSGSEILVRQMIGRALRGPAAGGTKEAFLVSFEDHWEQFRDWASPFDLVPDLVGGAEWGDLHGPKPGPLGEGAEELEEPPTGVDEIAIQNELPHDLERAFRAWLRENSLVHLADAFEAIPHGWYLLERDDEDAPVRRAIAVYEHQRPCWEAFIAHYAAQPGTAIGPGAAAVAFEEFFGDCDHPAPATHDIAQMLQHFAAGGEIPLWNDYEERRLADPTVIADDIIAGDLGERAKHELLSTRYDALAKAVYPSHREFCVAVDAALYERRHPDEETHRRRAVPVFAPRPEEQMRPGPVHDLAAFMADVLRTGSEMLAMPLPHAGEVTWTKRIMKVRFASAYYTNETPNGHGRITVNRLLDSPDVTADTMRMLLWHEYLHLYLKAPHPPMFRALEHRWPNWVAAYREMNGLRERFAIQYW